MAPTVLAALFLASAINAGLPGPCVMMTMGRTAGSGWRAGAAVSLGILAADALLLAGAAVAMMQALKLSPSALVTMKWAGVAALLALAAWSLWPAAGPPAPATRLSPRDGAAGFAVGVSSPYNLIFYLALLPQVLPARPDLAAVAAICVAILAGVAVVQAGTVLLALSVAGVGRGAGRWVDRACAASLLAFAVAAAMVPSGRADLDAGPTRVSAR